MERNQGTHTLAAKAVNLDEQNQVVMTQSLGKRYLVVKGMGQVWQSQAPTKQDRVNHNRAVEGIGQGL